MIVKLTAVRQQINQNIGNSQSTPFEFSEDDPLRLKPLSLEQQKKRARELLNALKRSDPEALDRFNQNFSKKEEVISSA